MVLRKDRLHRPCKRCEEMFIPTGRENWLCPKCRPQTVLDKLYEKSQKRKKLEKRLKDMSKA